MHRLREVIGAATPLYGAPLSRHKEAQAFHVIAAGSGRILLYHAAHAAPSQLASSGEAGIQFVNPRLPVAFAPLSAPLARVRFRSLHWRLLVRSLIEPLCRLVLWLRQVETSILSPSASRHYSSSPAMLEFQCTTLHIRPVSKRVR